MARMRNPLKHRFFIPASLLVAVGIGGLLAFSPGANATGSSSAASAPNPNAGLGPGLSQGGGVGAGNFAQGVALPSDIASPTYLGGPKNTGGANSTLRKYVRVGNKLVLVAYGNGAILYKLPSNSLIPTGEALFAQNCASCHGSRADGSAIAPPLIGVGPATVDFWVSSGRMPAATTNDIEAERKPARLSKSQAVDIAAWVNSLHPAVPFIPYPNIRGADLASGADLFSLNCAACHTITGAGDALAYGTNAPTLDNKYVTPQQVAEAIRTGPANMPRFTGNLTDAQVRDLVAYVTEKVQHPQNPGGAGLGGVGPVAEGFVGLLLGVGLLMLVAFWVGDRSK
jgi:ubiquinol-cytochrome c reductase cytochrome c subunit